MLDVSNALRREAGPVPYWQHHRRAKEALNFIIRILSGAAASVQDSKDTKGAPGVEKNRASRIVFISGEPGSGKSTLYLTLKAMLSSEAIYSEGYKPDSEGHKPDLTNLKKVRWLDALDLEVAGEEGENLLAAVLVRLFRNLEESSPIHSSGCEEAIKELEDLATDIGIAWEGNLRARAGALDPDTFSSEVIRTQGARLGINKRLDEALNKLAEKGCYGCDRNTLFVLPVDDFYLKPTASLQLLRLLRMISIPRLFFMVMGDIKTVEALFIEKSLADWTVVAGTSLFATQSERLDEALTRARELRARYLRKLLPPLQRADIEAMDWFEALDFKLDHSSVSDNRLEELLDQVELDTLGGESGKLTETLHKFLISPALPSPSTEPGKSQWQAEKQKRENRARGKAKDEEIEDREERKLKKIRSAYTALQIMEATPREIMDLGFALREVKRKRYEETRKKEEYKNEGPEADDKGIPQLLVGVRNIVNLVKEEQNFLNEKEQLVLEGILPTREYSSEDINFDMDRLCVKPTERKWKKKMNAEKKENEGISAQLWFRDHSSWDLSVNRKFLPDSNDMDMSQNDNECLKADKDPYAKLPPRQAAWYILLHDLAWHWNHDSVNVNLVKNLCEKLNKDNPVWKRKGALQVNLEQPFEDAAREAMKKFLTLFERFVDQSNKIYKAKQEEEKPDPDPSEDFRGWAIYSLDGVTYDHFPMPEFTTFRELDRFLFVWSRGLEGLKKPEEADVDKISSIWALAGWTVLTDTYEHETYNHFANHGDEWFKAFIATKGNFGERFGEFLRERRIVIQPAKDKSDEIDRWLPKLDRLLEKFRSKKEDSTQPSASADATKSDAGSNGGGTKP